MKEYSEEWLSRHLNRFPTKVQVLVGSLREAASLRAGETIIVIPTNDICGPVPVTSSMSNSLRRKCCKI